MLLEFLVTVRIDYENYYIIFSIFSYKNQEINIFCLSYKEV